MRCTSALLQSADVQPMPKNSHAKMNQCGMGHATAGMLEQLLAKYLPQREPAITFLNEGSRLQATAGVSTNAKSSSQALVVASQNKEAANLAAAVPATLPMADSPVNEDAKDPEAEKKPAAVAKSLEEFEEEAFHTMQTKRKGGMKRPSACKPPKRQAPKPKAAPHAAAKTKGAAKPKEVVKTTPKTKGRPKPAAQGPYGCIRCRGNVNGCQTCWQPGFAGVRLPGRGPWREYLAQKKAS